MIATTFFCPSARRSVSCYFNKENLPRVFFNCEMAKRIRLPHQQSQKTEHTANAAWRIKRESFAWTAKTLCVERAHMLFARTVPFDVLFNSNTCFFHTCRFIHVHVYSCRKVDLRYMYCTNCYVKSVDSFAYESFIKWSSVNVSLCLLIHGSIDPFSPSR